MEETTACAVCEAKASLLCSGCRTVRYCSPDHQRTHWKKHQLDCKAYKEGFDLHIGKHLIAKRDLKPGTIILREDPMIIGSMEDEGPAVCVGCCKDLEGKALKCPQCQWPMCGREQCWGGGSQHALGECELLKKAGGRVTGNHALWADSGVYEGIMVLRCLAMRERDPSKWEKLMELKHSGSSRRRLQSNSKGVLEGAEVDTVVDVVTQWTPDVPKETITKLCGIFLANSFELPEIKSIRSSGLRAVYYAASMISHCCVANATKTFTNEGQIVVRATVPIAKGTKICLNYTEPLWGTWKRQFDLEETRFAACRCQRCIDPMELGSFASGISCDRCPNQEGVLVPEDPFDKFSDWICHKCSDRQDIGFISGFVAKLGEDWAGLGRYAIAESEAFLRKYEKLVHPNHHYLTDVKFLLCKTLYTQKLDKGGLSIADENQILKKKEALILELLKLADIISPGMSHLRGILLYHLFHVKDSEIANLGGTEGSFPPCEVHKLLTEIITIMKEAHAILSWEPAGTEESRMTILLSKKLKIAEDFKKQCEAEIFSSVSSMLNRMCERERGNS